MNQDPSSNQEIKPVKEIDNSKPSAPPVGGAGQVPPSATESPKSPQPEPTVPSQTSQPQTIEPPSAKPESAPPPTTSAGQAPASTPPEIAQSDQSPSPQTPQPAQAQLPPAPPIGNSVGKRAVIRRPSRSGKILKTIIAIVLLLLITGGIFYFYFYKATVTIDVSPTPDAITINSQPYQMGEHRLNPGNYRITISKDGYISYNEEKQLGIGEKIDLSFELEKEITSEIVLPGVTKLADSTAENYIFFANKEGKIYSLATQSENPKPVEVTVGTYPNTRIALIANNNKFALILDHEALKIIDFNKTDLLNQTEAKLPPMASAINSVTWNTLTDNYFREVNSHIIYDFKTTYGWDLILASRDHSKSEILMQLESDRFSKVYLDWGNNPKQALIAGGELGLVDLATREYTQLSEETGFVRAQWSPNGQRGVALNSAGEIYKIEGTEATKTEAKMKVFYWVNESEIIGFNDSQIIKYNFDTDAIINYAEIDGISTATDLIATENKVYFVNPQGLKSANLENSKYEK